jgi:hypothetical protein
MQIHPHCQFKTDKVRARAEFLSPTTGALLYAMADWAAVRELPFVVTETVSRWGEDKQLERVSDTHRTARAFDLSIRNWPEEQIAAFMKEFENSSWGVIAAISATTGEKRLVLRHECGHGDHLHVQISRLYAVEGPLGSSRR